MPLNLDMKELLSKKERQKNVHDILNRLNPDKHNYNVMLLGFTDIIQSTFYNYMKSQAQSQTELKRFHERVNQGVNQVIDILEEHNGTTPEDMLILVTVMIEVINKALIRQHQLNEAPVKKTMT